MRFGIVLPQYAPGGHFDSAGLRTFLRRAEDLGFESVWTQEYLHGAKPVLGAVETMAYAAACTERVRIGCAVFVSPLHVPMELAKSVSTLDQLSGGRIEIGIATGGKIRPFAAYGITGEGLVSRFTEGLALMRALWTEPKVTFDGRFWQLDKIEMEPKPVQPGGPPVWFGANHPDALRRAVRLGDGFFGGGSTTTARFAEQVTLVRAALEEQQRDPATFPIAKRVYLALDDDPARAKEAAARGLADIYGSLGMGDMIAVAVHGTPDDCVEGLRAVAAAGAERILLHPLDDQAEQMERLVTDVLPHVG